MSTENPQKAFNGNDGVKLKDYFEHLIASVRESIQNLKENIDIKLNAMEKAISFVAETIQTRLETISEWRGMIEDILKRVVTRLEYETTIESTGDILLRPEPWIIIRFGLGAFLDGTVGGDNCLRMVLCREIICKR